MLAIVLWCVAAGANADLDRGVALLEAFQIEKAVPVLERAKRGGPYALPDHVRLYEKLGEAYASLGRNEQAAAAFAMVLALDPGHAISYTLSPKVTFVFERVRAALRTEEPPTILLSWPYALDVRDPVPVTVEVVADPRSFLKKGRVFWRLRGQAAYQSVPVALPQVGAHRVALLPAAAAGATSDQVIEAYLVAYDTTDSEVMRVADQERPRAIALRYTPPAAWYSRWWVWALAGTALAAGTGGAVYAATRELPSRINGSYRVE